MPQRGGWRGGWRVGSGRGRGTGGVATSDCGYGYKSPSRAFGDPIKDPLRPTAREYRPSQMSYNDPQVGYYIYV